MYTLFTKRRSLLVGSSVLLLALSLFFSCRQPAVKPGGEAAVKVLLNQQTDSLLAQLDLLSQRVTERQSITVLQNSFAQCRQWYKKTEGLMEYYFQGLTKRINGPALPDVKPEDGQVWAPHGFQVIEQYLYGGYTDTAAASLVNEIKLLQTDLRFVKSNMAYNSIIPAHFYELLQHQLIRITTIGITGADAPLSKLSIAEAAWSLQGINDITAAYGSNPADSSFAKAVSYLLAHKDFDSFNRLEFVQQYLMPLGEALSKTTAFSAGSDSLMTKPFRGTLANFLQGKGFSADYYAAYAVAAANPAKVELGKKLFFDKSLSRSGTISCANCHRPELYFTDGQAKAADFVHGGSLARNTPTLYYAALQSQQFWDLRSTTLEDQADEVMKNSSEFSLTSATVAKKILSKPAYLPMFKQAFAAKDSFGSFEVRNAIAAFVRSLSPFTSAFDAYMAGNKTAMTQEEVQGFNLFAGKAKCATCHFIPLFNGNIPPWLTRSESEIIGVPQKAVWQKAVIDPDLGRYKINQIEELRFAFKTPSIRNAAKTAPYMHNGVYNTLEEVVEFYHRGGGAGLGIPLSSQSLPFDSLALNSAEKKAVVSFMKTLTDKQNKY
jgi:cytochrome c peroxidase